MYRRSFRALRRTIVMSRSLRFRLPVLVALLLRSISVFDASEGVRDQSTGILRYLAFVWTFLLFPYLPLLIVLIALGMLFRKAWPRFRSVRAELFIGMLEEQVRRAETIILKDANVGTTEARQWEAKAKRDLAEYLGPNSHCISEFQEAGRLTTYEYAARQASFNHNLERQTQLLREFIDRTDRGDFAKELNSVSRSII
jgi:hypothetical protein